MTAAAAFLTASWRPGWPCDPHDVLRPLRRGAGDPAYQLGPDRAVWRAMTTPLGAATLHLAARPTLGEIALEAWGPGAEWAIAQAPAMLGAHDDPSGFDPQDELVRRAWAQNPHWRVTRTGLVFEALVAAVLEQKVTGQEAWFGWRTLLRRFGTVAPGPAGEAGMRSLPTPDAVAAIASWSWLQCGIDPARSRTVLRAAGVAGSLERTVGLDHAETEHRLRSVPGVGVWTAAEVRQRAHGDADAVSFGDYHVATHIGWALRGVPAMTDEELEVLLEGERPHRYRVQHVVTSRLPGRPRRGPRNAPRRHLPIARG